MKGYSCTTADQELATPCPTQPIFRRFISLVDFHRAPPANPINMILVMHGFSRCGQLLLSIALAGSDTSLSRQVSAEAAAGLARRVSYLGSSLNGEGLPSERPYLEESQGAVLACMCAFSSRASERAQRVHGGVCPGIPTLANGRKDGISLRSDCSGGRFMAELTLWACSMPAVKRTL
jgi:hypothetical protein